MTREERQSYAGDLEVELLKGCAMLSEYATMLSRDADTAFVEGAPLAALLCATAAIECHLRFEYGMQGSRASLFDLIQSAPINEDLRNRLHEVRKNRNQWVHVSDPSEDDDLLERPEYHEHELECKARKAILAMFEVIYLEQGV